MKKIIALLLAAVLLAGCTASNRYSSLSNGKDVLFTGPNNVSYTKDELYKALKVSSSDILASSILRNIAALYDQIDFEEIEKEADEDIEFYSSLGYEQYIIQNYGSLDAYKDVYVSSMITLKLAEIYVDENFDELVAENSPVKMQIAAFDSEEDAQACINDVNSGSTFDMAAINNNSANSAESSVYLDTDSSLAYEVKEYVNSVNATGVSTIIPSVSSTTDSEGNIVETTTYYVVNIESKDAGEFREDFIETMSSSLDPAEVKTYFFTKHKIEFFDQDLYELMSKNYEVLR